MSVKLISHVYNPQEEEEIPDPQDVLKEKCTELSSCAKLKDVFEECNESAEGTAKDCTQQLFDFVHCVDHCVSVA